MYATRIFPEERQGSLLFLVLSNAFPLFGILFLGWSLSPILFLYWAESGIIGLFNIAKMAVSASKSKNPLDAVGAFFSIPFFAVHYSVFMAVHLIFLILFFGLSLPSGALWEIALGALFLSFSHLLSFVSNFLGRREYEGKNPLSMMFAPYKRIVIMHLTIIFGAFLAAAFGGSQKPFAILLVVMKTFSDAVSHSASHGGFGFPKLYPSKKLADNPSKPL